MTTTHRPTRRAIVVALVALLGHATAGTASAQKLNGA